MNARLDIASLLPTLADIEAAAEVVYRDFAATPQYRWATLSAAPGHRLLGQTREPHAGGRVQDPRRPDLL